MGVELRRVDSAGNYAEFLPDWSNLTFSQDMLAPGTLTFSYPVQGTNSSVLEHTTILVVLLDGVEPDNGRFVYDSASGSRIAESDGSVVSYGCTSVLSLGTYMMLAPSVGSEFITESDFDYKDKTAGWLARKVIDVGMSRNNQPVNGVTNPQNWLTVDPFTFTHLVDSSNTAWPFTVDVLFKAGDTLLTVLDWLATNGFAEPLMKKKALHLLRPDKNGRDLSVGAKPIALQTGKDFIEASYETTSKDMISSLFVRGENNTCVWVQDSAAIAKWGYREGVLDVSNASNPETLRNAGKAYLGIRKDPRMSYTYSVSAMYLDENTAGVPRPFVDYQVGDTILVLDGFSVSSQRIRLMSATWPNARAATVNLTFNDLIEEREVEFERRMSRLGL